MVDKTLKSPVKKQFVLKKTSLMLWVLLHVFISFALFMWMETFEFVLDIFKSTSDWFNGLCGVNKGPCGHGISHTFPLWVSLTYFFIAMVILSVLTARRYNREINQDNTNQ